MDDYIRRADAMDALESMGWYHQAPNKEMVHGANSTEHQAWYKEEDVFYAIEAVPAADVVEVRRGQWIYEPGHIPHCSECGRYSDDADTGEAVCCPFCGAKMDGGQDDV